ncbi:MAG: discoidin domain-containing protein [Dysgonamonadaceae bacterium]|jgi:alpha-mannosidase|nr:discoidin domain-containing protein [Dysgonamonadaceae bacterium]
MNRKIIVLLICLIHAAFALPQEKTLSFISDSHLDTQWNWDVKTTIDQYILNTMMQNFPLFDKYSGFQFNFESAIHYMCMKEYYPVEYARLKEYIRNGRWHISGGAVNASDVMIPSAESIIRNFLYGQTFYKNEFGTKGGSDIMLPDCFGFPYSLPTLGKHCGATGFHTAKLAWGSAYDYNSLAPFGIWKGVDGSEIYAIFKGEPYDDHGKYNKDMSKDQDMLNLINSNEAKYGIPAVFRYIGPSGDRGGGLQDNPDSSTENTPYWLQRSMDSDGLVTVKMETPSQIFQRMDQYRNDKYFTWDNELPMTTHGTGCYTSQTIMKYWNRKNELLADATEKSSVISHWLGGLKYPSDILRESWIRLLWHQFHDDLTGTSIPGAYNFSYNDEALVNMDLSKTLLNSVGAVAVQMNTQVEGIPLVIYNPLSVNRKDIVEASVTVNPKPANIRVLDENGDDVPAQILGYDSYTGKLSFIFQATVLPLGYAAYELRLNETVNFESSLSVTRNLLENESYQVGINSRGDVASIYDKKNGKELLAGPLRLAIFNDRSESWPAWEIMWNDVNTEPAAYVDENVDVSIAENGPLRVSLKISRRKNGSEFVQFIRLTGFGISDRIDFVNEVNWQSRGSLLKAVFPLRTANPKATYDLSIGAIERGVNTSRLYEVQGHQWADQTHTDGSYGISILNDCKYGWDKPNNSTLRLSLIHTPAVGNNYTHHKDQDLGLNRFTYSFYRHTGAWNEATQWEASRLNQPLLAFQTEKHDGILGKSCGFISLNTDRVAIKALKKAEESDEIIVRIYELTGENQNDVKITFPANIISANEVNGIEEKTGEVSYNGNSISFNIGKFQPKTFAVRLENPSSPVAGKNPSSIKIGLECNIDVMSYDSKKNDVSMGVSYAYPAELISDTVISDGIEFAIASRSNGNRNAVYCNGQTITLPANANAKKMYILAASKNEKGSEAEFTVDGTAYSFNVPYYAGKVAIIENEYNLETEYRRENIAFTATHRHNVGSNSNDSYNFMYMYKYCIALNGNASNLTLPNNRDIYVFAVSLSDNTNDDIIPASAITSLPEKNSDIIDNDCSFKLIPASVRASNQNGSSEGPEKAIDGDLNTKWCVTNNSSPWMELTFDPAVEICRWFVMNAGIESGDYITSAFRLQKYENRQWIDVDIVENNNINKVYRTVEPFTASRIRLQINKGEQNGNTTRILEFAVFGKETTAIKMLQNTEKNIYVSGNYPNPFRQKTAIRCVTPENVTELNLQVYDLWGRTVDSQNYTVSPQNGISEIIWNRKQTVAGVYFYSISAIIDGKHLYSNINKMVVV